MAISDESDAQSIGNNHHSLSQSANSVGQDDPLFVSSSDNPSLLLVNSSMLFNGENFLNWSRAIVMSLDCRNKTCFIDGSYVKPVISDKKYKLWLRVDSLVKCWILNSMNANIAGGYMLVRSAKQLWDELLEQYGQTSGPLLYQLRQDLTAINQDKAPLAEYYGKLKRKWDDLQDLEPYPDCTCGALNGCTCGLLKRVLEIDSRSRLIKFLMGLDFKYDTVRSGILAMDPLPTVNKAYSLLLRVEKQYQITDMISTIPESSAMVVHHNFHSSANKDFNKKGKVNDTRYCSTCKKRGHTPDFCFQKPGAIVPDWYKQLQEKRAVTGANSTGGFGTNSSGEYGGLNFGHIGNTKNNKFAGYSGASILDSPLDCNHSIHSVVPDQSLVNALCQEVFKKFQDGSFSHITGGNQQMSSVNFAGPSQ